MIRFVKPPQEQIKIQDRTFWNHAISINHVVALAKSYVSLEQFSEVYDIPTIEFRGANLTWYFSSKEERDEEFNSLLKRFSL